jgi:hypothetical protein
MTEDRWQFILDLDEELLKGGVILSEWCTFIVRCADLAFTGDADLAAIITAMAGIETHLRAEHAGDARTRFVELIERSSLKPALN